MVADHSVDAGKINANGISNGDSCPPDRSVSCRTGSPIALVAATIRATSVSPNCNPGRPVTAFYIHGASDPLAPFTGGLMTAGGTSGGTILSHFQTIDRWEALNRCNSTPVTTDLPDVANDGTTIRQRAYSGDANGSEVLSYVLLNNVHTWPQGCQYLGESVIGLTSQDMNANKVISSFLKRFKL